MIKDLIKKENISLEGRGIPSDSYFHVKFADGSEITEHEANWKDISEEKQVLFLNRKKVVQVCVHQLKEITLIHGDIQTTIDVGTDERVYQSIAMIAYLTSSGETIQKVIGRKVGKIKGEKVIEERLIDGRTNEIIGFTF